MIIYDFPNDAALSIAQMASLFDRREQLNRHFFKSILLFIVKSSLQCATEIINLIECD